MGFGSSRFDLGPRLPTASPVEQPDREIEYRRERDPNHQRDEAVRCEPVQPMESHGGGNDQYKLRDDIDQAEKRTLCREKQPRPCGVQRQLSEEKDQCSTTRRAGWQKQYAPDGERHEDVQDRPYGTEHPVRRVEGRFGQARVPRYEARIGGDLTDNRRRGYRDDRYQSVEKIDPLLLLHTASLSG